MRILYHHRTRATDAQRIHIQELIGAFRAAGHEVLEASLVSASSGAETVDEDAKEAGWKSFAKRIPGAYDLAQLGYNAIGVPMLARKILAGRPDFLYERYALFNFAGVLAARVFGIPLILEVNAPLALENRREQETSAYWLARWAERTICNMASRVIVVSTPLRRILAETGVRSEKMVVMPNGVNPARFTGGDGAAVRSSLGLEGKVVAGFIGWFRPWHGLEMLIEAFVAGGFAERNAAILMVGDGPARTALEEQVARHGLEALVKFAGAVPHNRIPDYLGAFDIAVQPAATEYACPMKILEYMGMGKAILAPRQENIEELLRDGAEAVLFEPGDPVSLGEGLDRLLAPEVRRRLGEAARRAIEDRQYLWSGNARRVIDLAGGSV